MGSMEQGKPSAIEGRALDAPRERVGVGVVTLEGAVLGAAEPEMQSNTEPDTTAPRPGAEKIGGACRRLDRRPLGYAPHASLGEDVRVFSSAFGAMFDKRRSGR